MPAYRINCGNSTTGPIGFVARLEARSAEVALEQFKDFLPEHVAVLDSNGIQMNVYFNVEAVTINDVEDDE